MESRQFRGVWTALVTPFLDDGSIDWTAFDLALERQIAANIAGVVINGTTGESPTVSDDETAQMIARAREKINGRCFVMVGTGSNSTEKSISKTRAATEAGADAVLVVNPYYNKPTQAGLYQHFRAIAESTTLPIVLYNIKGRTGVNLETETLLKLAKDVKNIVGVKEASGDLEQIKNVCALRPLDFVVLSGDDGLTFKIMRECGVDGVISVAANILPARVVEMVQLSLRGKWLEAKAIDEQLQSFFSALFVETNPIPVKYAGYRLGWWKNVYRLPLCAISQSGAIAVDKALTAIGLREQQNNSDVIFFPKNEIIAATTEYATPFFLYSEERLRANCRRLFNTFKNHFVDFRPLFATKANFNPDIVRIIHEEGFGLDCSSLAELWLAKKLGIHGMHTGNYTTDAELRFALMIPNMIVNLDDVSMIESLQRLGMPEIISFRVNPGITNGSMESLLVAGPNAKFGVPFERVVDAYRRAREAGAHKFGIHMMTGSNVLDENYFYIITRKLLEIVADIRLTTGIEIEFMNIGGGFGVPYRPDEKSLDINLVAANVARAFEEQCRKFNINPPQLMIEPGRYLTADAGWLVGRVTVVKDGYKKFVGIDAASNDLARPSIYNAYHHVSVINGATESETVTVVGSICENNDQLARDRLLPRCAPGDLVIIHNAGGHSFAMGHNYNGRTRHAEYLCRLDGSIKLIRQPERIEDLFKGTNLTNV